MHKKNWHLLIALIVSISVLAAGCAHKQGIAENTQQQTTSTPKGQIPQSNTQKITVSSNANGNIYISSSQTIKFPPNPMPYVIEFYRQPVRGETLDFTMVAITSTNDSSSAEIIRDVPPEPADLIRNPDIVRDLLIVFAPEGATVLLQYERQIQPLPGMHGTTASLGIHPQISTQSAQIKLIDEHRNMNIRLIASPHTAKKEIGQSKDTHIRTWFFDTNQHTNGKNLMLVSTIESWPKVSAYLAEKYKPTQDDIAAFVHKFPSKRNPREIFYAIKSNLYPFAERTKEAIEFIKPKPVRYTLKRKGGVCKDLIRVLAAALTNAGIEYKLVFTDTNMDISPKFPTERLNHVIIYVQTGTNQGIYLDPLLTNDAGEVSQSMNGKSALFVSKNGSYEIRRIKAPSSKHNAIQPTKLTNTLLHIRKIAKQGTSNKVGISMEIHATVQNSNGAIIFPIYGKGLVSTNMYGKAKLNKQEITLVANKEILLATTSDSTKHIIVLLPKTKRDIKLNISVQAEYSSIFGIISAKWAQRMTIDANQPDSINIKRYAQDKVLEWWIGSKDESDMQFTASAIRKYDGGTMYDYGFPGIAPKTICSQGPPTGSQQLPSVWNYMPTNAQKGLVLSCFDAACKQTSAPFAAYPATVQEDSGTFIATEPMCSCNDSCIDENNFGHLILTEDGRTIYLSPEQQPSHLSIVHNLYINADGSISGTGEITAKGAARCAVLGNRQYKSMYFPPSYASIYAQGETVHINWKVYGMLIRNNKDYILNMVLPTESWFGCEKINTAYVKTFVHTTNPWIIDIQRAKRLGWICKTKQSAQIQQKATHGNISVVLPVVKSVKKP